MQSGVGNSLIRFFNGLQRNGVRSGLQVTAGKVKHNVRSGVNGIEDVKQVAAAVIELRMEIKDAAFPIDTDLQYRHAGILNQQGNMKLISRSRRIRKRK